MGPDAFAALLGISVSRGGQHSATATVEVTADHLNPNGQGHGGLTFAVASAALAAAANDEQYSGVATSVHVDYVRPASLGDTLVAETELEERLDREDLFAVRVLRQSDGALVARGHARMTRRPR